MSTALGAAPPSLSYELYPPVNRDATESVFNTIAALEVTDPDYVSVTCSGSPARRNASLELIEHLIQNTRLRPLAHLTCVGESRESLRNLIRHFVSLGVRGVLALRGDLPPNPHPSSTTWKCSWPRNAPGPTTRSPRSTSRPGNTPPFLRPRDGPASGSRSSPGSSR